MNKKQTKQKKQPKKQTKKKHIKKEELAAVKKELEATRSVLRQVKQDAYMNALEYQSDVNKNMTGIIEKIIDEIAYQEKERKKQIRETVRQMKIVTGTTIVLIMLLWVAFVVFAIITTGG